MRRLLIVLLAGLAGLSPRVEGARRGCSPGLASGKKGECPGKSPPANQSECPEGLPPGTYTCYSGVDAHQAAYLIVVPQNYNNQLVLWNHGYNFDSGGLGAGDLGPPLVLLQEGFAVAASSYRPNPAGRGGWAVADAAFDTENVRRIFVQLRGRPNATFVVGASEGGLVTASIIEQFGVADDGRLNYNGALPMCGPLAGGRKNFCSLFDLRVIYQYYCRNLPRPSEQQYDLFLGLAPGQELAYDEFNARLNECTGVDANPESRTPLQSSNLANILNATRISEGFLPIDLGYAVYGLQELVQVRLGGHSPVTNLGVLYSGTTDDAALNREVYRAGSDQIGRDYMRTAYDPTGQVQMPTLTLHLIGDDLVIVENERAYRETREGAGTARNLFQTYLDTPGHCAVSPAEFQGTFHALLRWTQSGNPPTQEQVARLCEDYRSLGTCNFNPTFQPQPFESRVPPRDP